MNGWLDNQRGGSNVLILSITLFIMFGVWAISDLLSQERHTFDQYDRYMTMQYVADSIHEIFLYKINDIMDEKEWYYFEDEEEETGEPNPIYVFEESDAQDIQDFIQSSDDWKRVLNINVDELGIDVHDISWMESNCEDALQPVYNFNGLSVCAKLSYSASYMDKSVDHTIFVAIDDIEFVNYGGIMTINSHDPLYISKID